MAEFDDVFRAEYLRLVRALSLSFSPPAAEEAVADAFVVAHRRWDRVSRLDDPVGWVRRVAVNHAISAQRSLFRRQRRELQATSVAYTSDVTEELLDLRAAVAALPPRQRLVVSLHYLAALSVEEVAAVLEISPGTVKSTLFEARARLRKEQEHA